jgi:hypothetical protein
VPPGSDERAERLAKNEAFFREANEQLEREALLGRASTFDCICECSRRGCVARLGLTTTEYERLRTRSDQFALAHGHEDTTIETVVETFPNYLVVQKFGTAGDEAERLDPRDD